MREAIERVIDDLETKRGAEQWKTEGFLPSPRLFQAEGSMKAYEYAIKQLKDVLANEVRGNRSKQQDRICSNQCGRRSCVGGNGD